MINHGWLGSPRMKKKSGPAETARTQSPAGHFHDSDDDYRLPFLQLSEMERGWNPLQAGPEYARIGLSRAPAKPRNQSRSSG
jgi:hypothetical protein